jgi:hypothetical protein
VWASRWVGANYGAMSSVVATFWVISAGGVGGFGVAAATLQEVVLPATPPAQPGGTVDEKTIPRCSSPTIGDAPLPSCEFVDSPLGGFRT